MPATKFIKPLILPRAGGFCLFKVDFGRLPPWKTLLAWEGCSIKRSPPLRGSTMKIATQLRGTVVGAVLALAVTAALAANDGSSASSASDKISIGTMSVIAAPVVSVGGSAHGDASGVAAGSVAVVASGVVQGAAEGVEVILSSVGSAAKLSVKLSGKAVDAIGMSVGTTVQVVSETTGTLLLASGKVVAFIPNALGEALLSQKRLQAQ